MKFDDYSVLEFPRETSGSSGFVYVICWIDEGSDVPLYVGQTHSVLGRMNDYFWAGFQACTDFRVGEAVNYLKAKGLNVVVRYKGCEDRKVREQRVIGDLRKDGRKLLNDYPAFNYKTAHATEERERVHHIVDELLEAQNRRLPSAL